MIYINIHRWWYNKERVLYHITNNIYVIIEFSLGAWGFPSGTAGCSTHKPSVSTGFQFLWHSDCPCSLFFISLCKAIHNSKVRFPLTSFLNLDNGKVLNSNLFHSTGSPFKLSSHISIAQPNWLTYTVIITKFIPKMFKSQKYSDYQNHLNNYLNTTVHERNVCSWQSPASNAFHIERLYIKFIWIL